MNANEIAKQVFMDEANEIMGLSKLLTEDFQKSVDMIIKTSGKVIISGMGKSGIIGQKIAASLASTGTPSFFLHPAEAFHGDLGMIEKDDVLILLSYSGETDEVLKLIPYLKDHENQTVSITGNSQSTLAKNTTYHLNVSVSKEACLLNLAPTSSTTATLAMGDALVVALMKTRGFKEVDFAKRHPGGSLGRKLLTKVNDVMTSNYIPTCAESAGVEEIIGQITRGSFGLIVVVKDFLISGVITDGDIRRVMKSNQNNFFELKAKEIMTRDPKTIHPDDRISVAEEIMINNQINALVVSRENRPEGIIQLYSV